MSSSNSSGGRRFPLPLSHVRGEARAGKSTELLRPQRTVHSAAVDAERLQAPAGLGLDSAVVRARMVERLQAHGIVHEQVLGAFAAVERHRFVDSALVNQAYEDTSLPIGFGQTISKPSVVAQMLQGLLQELPPTPGTATRVATPARPRLRRVLEIGTGCGYQAALLAHLAERVISIERVGALAEKARTHLVACGVQNVQVLHADGRLGAPGWAPFDAIVSAAGGDDLPEAWIAQLAPGGRLVAPGAEVRPGAQALVRVDRHPTGVTRRIVGEVYFVPLKSGAE